MKKGIKTVIITLLLLSVLTAAGMFWLMKGQKEDKQTKQEIELEESGENSKKAFIYSTPNQATALLTQESGKNVLVFDTVNVYDTASSEAARVRIDRLAARTSPSFDEPLIAYNPFGTNANTFYFYFKTNRRVSVKYTITVEDEKIPDFVRTVYNGGDNNLAQEHEFTVGGLVPGMMNYIIISLCTEDGTEISSHTYSFEAQAAASGVPVTIPAERGKVSEETSTNGLYFLFPNGINEMLSYDNSGVLRGETILEKDSGKKIVADNNHIFYAVSDTKLVSVSPCGQVMGTFPLERWGTVMDFDYDGYGNLYAVTQKSRRSSLLRIDLSTGETKQALKFAKGIAGDSIALSTDGCAYVSTTAPDGIVKVEGVASNVAKVTGVIGDKQSWANTSYRKKRYKIEGKGSYADGISRILFNSDKGTLSFLNNNSTKKGHSYYYEYQPNDGKQTVSVVRDFKVPYSEKRGSGQRFGSHYIVCSGDTGVYSEYDTEGKLMKQFSSGMTLNGVLKLNLKQTCFK